MDYEFAVRINEEIERYKNTLLYYAKKREGNRFKSKAGVLLKYVEAIALSEIQREFFRRLKFIFFVRVIIII